MYTYTFCMRSEHNKQHVVYSLNNKGNKKYSGNHRHITKCILGKDQRMY